MFLNDRGEATWLIMRTEDDFRYQLDVLSSLEHSEQVIDALESREKLLFMLSDDEYEKPVSQWGQCLFDAKKLSDTCWYSIVHGHIKDTIQWRKVISYKQFMDTI